MTAHITPPPHNHDHLTHPKYRADIDGLRAIAILSVVGFHAFPDWVKGGFIGVDIFFVISGYLISTIIFDSLEHNRFSFIEFYSRRIKRIFPALLLVLIACFAFGWFYLLANEYKQLGKHIAGGAGFVSNFLFWRESGYFDNAAETKPLLHLWSLGVEEQFYIIWPLLLWLAWKKRFNLLTIAIVVGVISFALNIDKVRSDSVAAFYSPQTRFWELMAGSILAHITLHKRNMFPQFRHRLDTWLGKMIYAHAPEANGKTLRNVQSMFGAVLIAIGVITITKERHFPGWWAVLPILGAMLIISAGSQAWLNRAVLSNRILVWVGLISFPLYLWHWPLLSFARIVESETLSASIRIAAVSISIVLAWLTYRLIEKPIRFGKYSKAKTISLLVLITIVGYVGYNTYMRDGLGFRFPKVLQQLIEWDYKPLYREEFREGSCFLRPEQNATAFDACKTREKEGVTQSLLLWGDSNAAHFYQGYENSFGDKYKIIQRTASSCPPILGMEFGPNCKGIQSRVIELINKEKPNKVVLSAMWVAYDDDTWGKIEITINKLRKMGINNIDLIGPVPQWEDGLPTQLFKKFKSDAFRQIPYRMDFGLKPKFVQLDSRMEDFSRKLKVNYISPRKILCNELGCITRFGETFDTLTTYDSIHLSAAASRFVVSQFPKN